MTPLNVDGEQITAKGIYRDPMRSSHAHMVKASGALAWVYSAPTPIAWAKRVWALPFYDGAVSLCALLCPAGSPPSQCAGTRLAKHPARAALVA